MVVDEGIHQNLDPSPMNSGASTFNSFLTRGYTYCLLLITLLLISNLSIQYSDFAIPMDIQKRMLIVLLCFICSYKKVKKKKKKKKNWAM